MLSLNLFIFFSFKQFHLGFNLVNVLTYNLQILQAGNKKIAHVCTQYFVGITENAFKQRNLSDP